MVERSQLQVEARALGDPTRHAIFRYLADAGAPVGVAELTGHFGFNHNAIRQHLGKLVDAGLVAETTAPPAGRGRPRLEYRIEPATDSRWGVTGPYEHLSLLLAEMVRSGDTPVEVGRRAGARAVAERSASGTQHVAGAVSGAAVSDSAVSDERHPVDVLVDQMARQGFAPEVQRRRGAVDVVLHECPFATAAIEDPDTICQLHLGIAEGVAEAVPGLSVEGLVVRDPRRAQCRLRCSVDDVT